MIIKEIIIIIIIIIILIIIIIIIKLIKINNNVIKSIEINNNNIKIKGVQELMGIAARGNYDLTQHSISSGKNLDYLDDSVNTNNNNSDENVEQKKTEKKYIPHVIEPSIGFFFVIYFNLLFSILVYFYSLFDLIELYI
jgi:glycyl-tRNA synthetase (class II)